MEGRKYKGYISGSRIIKIIWARGECKGKFNKLHKVK